jgi:hypothetical protein
MMSCNKNRVRDVLSKFGLNDVETSHHLILIRLYFMLTILITEDGPQSSF